MKMSYTIKRLEKMLKAYDNFNTPPSKKLPASNTKPRNGNSNGTKKKRADRVATRARPASPNPQSLKTTDQKIAPTAILTISR